jgi:predicted Holliday junction resolvase-like endonuclease
LFVLISFGYFGGYFINLFVFIDFMMIVFVCHQIQELRNAIANNGIELRDVYVKQPSLRTLAHMKVIKSANQQIQMKQDKKD